MQTNWEVYAITALFTIPALIIFIKALREIRKKNNVTKIEKEGTLSQERMDQIQLVLKEFMLEKKPFLQKRYSISQLANDIHVAQHHVSAFINSYYKMNFNDFVNQYRVAYSKIMLINEEWNTRRCREFLLSVDLEIEQLFIWLLRRPQGRIHLNLYRL